MLAASQVKAGADVLDVNVGAPSLDEFELLPKIVRVITSAVDAAICHDSAIYHAFEAAPEVTPGKPLIKSVNGEKAC